MLGLGSPLTEQSKWKILFSLDGIIGKPLSAILLCAPWVGGWGSESLMKNSVFKIVFWKVLGISFLWFVLYVPVMFRIIVLFIQVNCPASPSLKLSDLHPTWMECCVFPSTLLPEGWSSPNGNLAIDSLTFSSLLSLIVWEQTTWICWPTYRWTETLSLLPRSSILKQCPLESDSLQVPKVFERIGLKSAISNHLLNFPARYTFFIFSWPVGVIVISSETPHLFPLHALQDTFFGSFVIGTLISLFAL